MLLYLLIANPQCPIVAKMKLKRSNYDDGFFYLRMACLDKISNFSVYLFKRLYNCNYFFNKFCIQKSQLLWKININCCPYTFLNWLYIPLSQIIMNNYSRFFRLKSHTILSSGGLSIRQTRHVPRGGRLQRGARGSF